MSETKKTSHTIGKIKQLIDLNGEHTNFDLSFKVTCRDDTPFNLLVVDQTTLDNTPELKYKEVKGSISGNIVADKNIYQNYFLILKAEKTCVVDVERNLKVLPKTPISSSTIPTTQGDSVRTIRKVNSGTSASTSINWTKIGLIALVVVIGLGVLWWLYKRKDPSKVTNDVPKLPSDNKLYDPSPNKHSPVQNHGSPQVNSPQDSRGFKPLYKHHVSLSPSAISQASSRSSDGGDGGNNSLLHRLRKFAR